MGVIFAKIPPMEDYPETFRYADEFHGVFAVVQLDTGAEGAVTNSS